MTQRARMGLNASGTAGTMVLSGGAMAAKLGAMVSVSLATGPVGWAVGGSLLGIFFLYVLSEGVSAGPQIRFC